MIYLTELVSADKYNEFAFFYQNKVSNIRCYILVIYRALPHILMKSQFSPVISKVLDLFASPHSHQSIQICISLSHKPFRKYLENSSLQSFVMTPPVKKKNLDSLRLTVLMISINQGSEPIRAQTKLLLTSWPEDHHGVKTNDAINCWMSPKLLGRQRNKTQTNTVHHTFLWKPWHD